MIIRSWENYYNHRSGLKTLQMLLLLIVTLQIVTIALGHNQLYVVGNVIPLLTGGIKKG